jgi:hypothetical protein
MRESRSELAKYASVTVYTSSSDRNLLIFTAIVAALTSQSRREKPFSRAMSGHAVIPPGAQKKPFTESGNCLTKQLRIYSLPTKNQLFEER